MSYRLHLREIDKCVRQFMATALQMMYYWFYIKYGKIIGPYFSDNLMNMIFIWMSDHYKLSDLFLKNTSRYDCSLSGEFFMLEINTVWNIWKKGDVIWLPMNQLFTRVQNNKYDKINFRLQFGFNNKKNPNCIVKSVYMNDMVLLLH